METNFLIFVFQTSTLDETKDEREEREREMARKQNNNNRKQIIGVKEKLKRKIERRKRLRNTALG